MRKSVHKTVLNNFLNLNSELFPYNLTFYHAYVKNHVNKTMDVNIGGDDINIWLAIFIIKLNQVI